MVTPALWGHQPLDLRQTLARLDMDTLGQTHEGEEADLLTIKHSVRTHKIIQFFVSFIQCAGCKPVPFNSHLHLV